MKDNRPLATIIICLLATAHVAFAAGISIEPGATLTFVRRLGDEIPGKPLRIINVNSKEMEYNITQVTEGFRLKGYFPLPDTSWVTVEKKNFILYPHDTVDIPVIFRIPDEARNYNRAWYVEFSVEQSRPVDVDGHKAAGAVIQLGARSTWFIETPMNKELPPPGEDKLAVAPSIWAIQYGDSTENKAELPFKIRNDDNITHEYEMVAYLPDYGDTMLGRQLDIFPLLVNEKGWVLDKSWVKPKPGGILGNKTPTFKLEAGEVAEHSILIEMPPSSELGERRYEAIVLVKPDGDSKWSRFCRVIISPGLKPSDSEE